MAEDDIDVEGDFNFKLETSGGLYDANELPSKSANLLPEYTNPPWMLEQGWSLDNGMDEKSKATIEKMLLEEQQYINGRSKGKYLGISKSVLLITAPSKPGKEPVSKRQWTDEEKSLFVQGLEQFGHSWSKISQLIPSRTTIQVKNYAKQYLKTQAKKSSTKPPESATSLSGGLMSPTAETSTNLSLTDAEASVSTAQPTIIARSPLPAPPKSKPFKHKVAGAKQKIVHTTLTTYSLLNNSHQNSLQTVDSILTKNNSVKASTGNETKPATDNARQDQGPNCASKTEHFSDSDSEIDIDIENDDEDENAILQCRSASPSSVYDKLLEQAKVKAVSKHDNPPQREDEDEASDMCNKIINEDGQEGCESTAELCEELEDSEECSGKGEESNEKSAVTMMGEGPGQSVEEYHDHVETLDVKHIVNGVTASTGEVFEFPIPIEDKELLADRITDEEKMVHSEFFDGRPLKTPERFLKIRNYILDCWKKSQPGYLNKTSVRPGLKNCGDVNCIGRIHAYLECIGAINFGCEQAAYNNPGKGAATVSKLRHFGRDYQPVLSAMKLDAMRPRKRRIRDASGHWVDEKELEGKTIEHKPEDDPSKTKGGRNRKVIYDPFKLVPCQPFTEDKQAPFKLEVLSTALAVMDIHAHISRTEVIGMLGGQFDTATCSLTISIAVPCKSISTGMQCEMDPVSQTHASEQIEDVGMCVVGWYHSHPTFAPNPSVRDIETQQKFQYWFAKGGSHFVGLIISPYSPMNTSVVSDIRCLTIGEDVAKEYLCNTPYQFSYSVVYRDNMREILGPASELAEKYATYSSRVGLSCIYRSSLGITCLSKMLQSVKQRLEPAEAQRTGSSRKVDDILHWLEQIFVDKFSSASSPTPITPTASAVPPSDDDMQV